MGLRPRLAVLVMTASLVVAGACEPLAGTPTPTPGPKRVKIVSSLPLSSADRVFTVPIANAIKMALEEQGGIAGSTIVDYESYDDASAAKQSWDPEVEAANARQAVADRSVVAYIGTYNSGAAQISIPILCAANMAMISPANTDPGLTKPGVEADEPGKFYPNNCKRNYSRVVPADDVQGAVAARWAKDLGARRVYVIHENRKYGLVLGGAFRNEAKKIGLEERGYEVAPKAEEFRALASRVAASGADLVYYCGIPFSSPGFLLRDLKNAIPSIAFMACDGVAYVDFAGFVRQAGDKALGAYITVPSLEVRHYTGAQKAWADRYRAKYGDSPEFFAIFGYEAAKVVLAAIAKAGARADERETIRDLVMATRNFDGVLGRWSFDENGDTSLPTMAGLKVTKIGADYESSVEFQKVLH